MLLPTIGLLRAEPQQHPCPAHRLRQHAYRLTPPSLHEVQHSLLAPLPELPFGPRLTQPTLAQCPRQVSLPLSARCPRQHLPGADTYQRFRSLPDELVEVSEQLWQLAKMILCAAPDTLESWTLTHCDDLVQGCLDQLLTTLRTRAAREAAGKCADYFERNRAQC